MHDDERFEDYGPCGISEAILKGAKDFGDSGLSGVGGHENMLDVLGLGRSELNSTKALARVVACIDPRAAHLDLGSTLDRLLEGSRHD